MSPSSHRCSSLRGQVSVRASPRSLMMTTLQGVVGAPCCGQPFGTSLPALTLHDSYPSPWQVPSPGA